MKKGKAVLPLFLLASTIVSLAGSLTYGVEVVFPAAQLERGSSSLAVYGTRVVERIVFAVKSRDEIQVQGNSFFSEATNDLASDGAGSSAAARWLANPFDGLYYWLEAGGGSYELEIPSATVKNRVESRSNGYFLGAGIRRLLFPDTIVTPALAFQAGVRRRIYPLERFRSGAEEPRLVNDELQLTELHLAFLVSKRYRGIEPYGGLNITRIYSTLRDKGSLGEVSGTADAAGIVLGARINVFPRESLTIEGNYSTGLSLAAGWTMAF